MCGIVGYTGSSAAAPILLKGLSRLEYRGYDSAGIAVLHDGGIEVEKVSGRIARLCEKTRDGEAAHPLGHPRGAHGLNCPPASVQRRALRRGAQRHY